MFDVTNDGSSSSKAYSIGGSGTATISATTATGSKWVKLGDKTNAYTLKLSDSTGSDVKVCDTTTTTAIALKGGDLAWAGLDGAVEVELVSNEEFKQTITSSVIDINKSSNTALLKLCGSGSKLESAEVPSYTVIFNVVKKNWVVNSTSSASVDLEAKTATLANARV